TRLNVNPRLCRGGVFAVEDAHFEIDQVKLLDNGIVRAQRLAQRQVESVRRADADACGVKFFVFDLQADDSFRVSDGTNPNTIVNRVEETPAFAERSQSKKLKRRIGVFKLVALMLQRFQLGQQPPRRLRIPYKVFAEVFGLESNVADAGLIAYKHSGLVTDIF